MKKTLDYLMVTVKGICMGAADVIPGVSGGTIAFMTGIYEELVGSINAINGTAVKLLFRGKLKEFWKHINGNFLLSLVLGILISVFSLAKVMQFLLTDHPVQTWSFFFGLIIASSIFILKGISNWKASDAITLACGIVLGVVVCTLSPTQTPDGIWFIFLCGAIAICAMILPGISGSFILLILGKYEYMMATIAGLLDGLKGGTGVTGAGEILSGGELFWHSALVIVVFVVGAIIGILAFSKFLHWLLARYHRPTLLVLAGFIIGSLIKVWPWHGTNDLPVLPGMEDAAGIVAFPVADAHIAGAVIFALAGFAIVFGIEIIGKKVAKRKAE